jgi:transposase InsO family protein
LTLSTQNAYVFADYGLPNSIRTDNEAIFTAKLFRSVLFILGIRHKTIDKHCRWQNGRIERLFGTLKPLLKQVSCDSVSALNRRLFEFGLWHNHLRPHQHLYYLTPAERWHGMTSTDFVQRPPKQVCYVNAWGGLLTGFIFGASAATMQQE